MTTVESFAWGFLGSAAVEVVTLVALYVSPGRRRLPRRYHEGGFWATRAALAVLAGLLAAAYGTDKRILALSVGAATPLLITFTARGIRLMTPDSSLPKEGATPEPPAGQARDRAVAESRRGHGRTHH